MIKFRQLIREGESGRDVKAVKLAMRAMHVAGSGGLIVHGTHAKFAGDTFRKCIVTVQKHHGLHADGVYGEKTHAIIAPHFSAYMRWLYRTAAIRKPTHPPVPQSAVDAAKRLLELHGKGKLHDDNGRTVAQILATAQGKAVWSPLGRYVHLDPKVLRTLCYLIDDCGFTLGLYALCSDHFNDGVLGHAGGHAADVSTVDVSVLSTQAGPHVHRLLKALHANQTYKPWQLISGGFANHLDSECESLTIPSASYYGYVTMTQHCNHVHIGTQ